MHRIHGIIYCHSKWQKDIFIILISIFSIFRVEICLFANILESIHLSQFSTGDEKEVKTDAKTVATLLANGKQFFPENVSNCCPKRWKQTKMFAKLKSMLGTTTQHTHTHIYTHTCPERPIHKSFLAYFWLVQLLQLQVRLLRALTAWSAARELFANAENCSNICCIWPRCCCSWCCYCRTVPRLACHTKAYVVMKQKSRENL